MNTEQLNFKKNEPLIAENNYGITGGYYLETVVDKRDIWIRFIKTTGDNISRGIFLRNINCVRKATKKEVEDLLKS